MRRLIRSAQSDEDLIAIWNYIAADNPAAATGLLKRIDQRILTLTAAPFVGERQPQFGETTLRIIVGNYLVFYDVLPDAVHVLREFHAARKLDELFG